MEDRSLTIAYVTSRKDCRIEWFFESFERERGEDNSRYDITVVDHWKEWRDSIAGPYSLPRCGAIKSSNVLLRHVAPKPNVWNGPHRLTKEDWFAMASARNTALCLCRTSHIVFVDDLSVLMPGWLDAVKQAVEGNYIGCGAYKKVKQLVVENGVPVSYEETTAGTDNRLSLVNEDVAPCDGGWLYGCSVVAPVESLLTVGAWPEFCDGMGAEDYTLGIALRNAGFHLKYLRKMLTLESEELHFVEKPMRKTDKGVSPNDKSHAALNLAKQSKYFPNYYPGGMRALRDHVLNGGEFPTDPVPDRDWYDGQPIAEME